MNFEWDENKNEQNIKKHGISFEAAVTIFAGQPVTVRDAREYNEIRHNSIGEMEGTVVIVVTHTDRKGTIRIISARRANKKERNRYYGTL